MEEILKEYESYLRGIIERHPLGKGGTGVAMQKLLNNCKSFWNEYEPFAAKRIEEILVDNCPKIDRARLLEELIKIRYGIYAEHMPSNLIRLLPLRNLV